MTRESWGESEGERRARGNIEKDIDRKGREREERDRKIRGREGERVCVCLGGEIERGNDKET